MQVATPRLLLVVAMTLAAAGPNASEHVAAAGPSAVLVTVDASAPPPGDELVETRLRASGLDVTLVDDDEVGSIAPDDHDLLVISASVAPYKVGDEWSQVAVPLVTWESQLYDDLGFTTPGDRGLTTASSTIDVVGVAHPARGGFSGLVSVTTSRVRQSHGIPTDDATIVAVETKAPNRPVTFGYDAGSTMIDGTAPARRLALYLHDQTPQRWTDDGAELFDAGIAWALGTPTAPVNAAPIVDAGPDTTTGATTITLSGSATDDGLPSGTLSTTWSGPAGVSFDDPTSPTTDVTFTGTGVYPLTLTATDGQHERADGVTITVATGGPTTPGLQIAWITAGSDPSHGEAPAVDRLGAAGNHVVVIDDDDATPASIATADLVVVTSTVSPNRVDPAVLTMPVPILIWEPALYEATGFISPTGSSGQQTTGRRIDVVDSPHPVAAGLDGAPEVLGARKPVSWAHPEGEPTVVATVAGRSDRASVFAYDVGDDMATISAPARRVGFFLSYSGPRQLSADGWLMWDAAIAWLTDGAPSGDREPVASAAVTPTTGIAPLSVAVDGSLSSDPDEDIVAYDWTFGDGANASGVTAQHIFRTAGSFDVTLTVTDAGGRTDSVTTTVVVTGEDTWAEPAIHYRTRVSVDAGGHRRVDRPAVVPIDFSALLGELGTTGATFDRDSIRVVEVDDDDQPVGTTTAFQFDPSPGFEPTTDATGDLIIELAGSTAAGTTRMFDVYFDTAGQGHSPTDVAPRVVTTTDVTDEGLPAARFETPTGTWWFDLAGGGFSSLDDIDGDDWISHSSATGSAGEFRGIPNAVHPEGYFHPGNDATTSTITRIGPVRTTIVSESADGSYATTWHVYPTFAEMEMSRAAGDYWFLYEGTPGGVLDPAQDRVVRSSGDSIRASESFVDDLADEEWAYFTDPFDERALFVAHLDDDDVTDSYRPLDGSMTVFGFGRADNAVPILTNTPERFQVGLLETDEFVAAAELIRSSTQPITSAVGPVESLVDGGIPPVADAVATPSSGEAPLVVALDASNSTDDGSIVSASWDPGDGSEPVEAANLTHTYQAPGAYVATVTVLDDQGLSDTDSVVIQVGLPPLERSTDGLLVRYLFDTGSTEQIPDSSDVGPALDLVVDDPSAVVALDGGGLAVVAPTLISTPGAATAISDAVVGSDAITVEAWVRTSDLDQTGPARIVSMSSSASSRNVMVGQGVFAQTGDRIETRLRTSDSDANGRPALRTDPGSLDTALTHIVFTRAPGGAATTYVDGRVAAVVSLPGELSSWDGSMPLNLANEADGSRPWLGEYHFVAIYDREFERDDVCRHLGAGPPHGHGTGNARPTACLTADTTDVTAGTTVTFDASLSRDFDGAIVQYRWDFGDGATTTATPTVEHDFDAPGQYRVRLTTVDDLGATSSDELDVTVRSPAPGGRIQWRRIASPDPRLAAPDLGVVVPPPGEQGEQQTASLVADLDGDGDDDFVLAGRKSPGAGIVWYEFIDPTTGWEQHVLESEVLRIEAGGDAHDIDGDGDVDIVFGSDGTGSEIWWWENPSEAVDPGAATWQRHLIKDSGAHKHHDLLFGDVDGDGDHEFVYWNQRDDNTLFVAEIPNDPTGPWPAVAVFSNGAVDSEGMDIADVDGDGVDDIVGAGYWWSRQPDGDFVANPIDPTRGFSRSAVGQLVPGGRPEVVIDSGDDIAPLTWYEWDAGTSTWIGHELLDESTYGHSLRLGDVDGDGHLDVFSAEMLSPFDIDDIENPDGATRVFYGDGTGGFDLQIVAVGRDHHESRLADLDGDGDLDILGKRYNIDVPGVDIWLNDGPAGIGDWNRASLDDPAPWTPLFVYDADVDGDGLTDIVTGGWWYRNPGDLGDTWTRSQIGLPFANVAAVGDLDGDGDVDLVGSHWQERNGDGGGEFSWARNDGSGGFDVFPVADTDAGPFLQGADLTRLEPGGPLTIVLSWNQGTAGTTALTVPDDLAGDPARAPWTHEVLSPHSEGEAIVAVDLDGDDDIDLMLGSTWLRNDGATWTVVTIFELGTGQPDRIVLADIDGDGDDDAVIGNGHDPAGELSWYERPDDPEDPWPQHLVANLVNPQSVDVADLDGDGDHDIVVGEHNLDDLGASRMFVIENLGVGMAWQTHVVHVGDEHHDGARVADLDGDGDLDIASIGFIQRRVVVYEHLAR